MWVLRSDIGETPGSLQHQLSWKQIIILVTQSSTATIMTLITPGFTDTILYNNTDKHKCILCNTNTIAAFYSKVWKAEEDISSSSFIQQSACSATSTSSHYHSPQTHTYHIIEQLRDTQTLSPIVHLHLGDTGEHGRQTLSLNFDIVQLQYQSRFTAQGSK